MNYRQHMTDRCLACGTMGSDYNPLDPAHWLTKGSRPDLRDDPRNIMTLCRNCHMYEQEGNRINFAKKYPSVAKWLKDKGWELDKNFGKWILKA